jgi:hypothetical protein
LKRWIPLVSFVVLSSPFAAAQSIVFQDGFENGLANWTATGLWNAEQSIDTCGALAAPFPEGSGRRGTESRRLQFRRSASCEQRMLTLNPWVTLPTNAASVSLYFQSWVDTSTAGGMGQLTGRRHGDRRPNGGFTEMLCSPSGPIAAQLPWHERRVDLSQYAGRASRIAFSFWTVTARRTTARLARGQRAHRGRAGQTLCPSAHFGNTCPCDPLFGVGGGCFNAQGKSATLMSSGVASVAATRWPSRRRRCRPARRPRCSRPRRTSRRGIR